MWDFKSSPNHSKMASGQASPLPSPFSSPASRKRALRTSSSDSLVSKNSKLGPKEFLANIISDLPLPFARRKNSRTNLPDNIQFNKADDFVVIEMSQFACNNVDSMTGPIAGVSGSKALGQGHSFHPTQITNPTWCDKCGQFIWGMYKQSLRCQYCNYTCHHRCRQLVSLDCNASSDNTPTHSLRGIAKHHRLETSLVDKSMTAACGSDSTSSSMSYCSAAHSIGEDEGKVLPQSDGTLIHIIKSYKCPESLPGNITQEDLLSKVTQFNEASQGLHMHLLADGMTFRGFIRVHMDLHRPINVRASVRPPSIFDIVAKQKEEGDDRTITQSFFIPKSTVKALHITSETTTHEVIVALLKKFKVADNPRKFALYEKIVSPQNKYKYSLLRLHDHDHPLYRCLEWGKAELHNERFLMTENETGEVMWEAFTYPELDNFMRILDREEQEYERQTREKYKFYSEMLERALQYAKYQKGRTLTLDGVCKTDSYTSEDVFVQAEDGNDVISEAGTLRIEDKILLEDVLKPVQEDNVKRESVHPPSPHEWDAQKLETGVTEMQDTNTTVDLQESVTNDSSDC